MEVIWSIYEVLYTRCIYTWTTCWLLLVLTWPRQLETHSFSDGDRPPGHNVLKQVAIDPYTHHKLPVLKMLKRQIKSFRTGRKNGDATLTLVYTSNEPNVDIQWFQVIVVNSEEVMYPILPGTSNPRYVLSALHSGDVTASTLTIPHKYHEDDHIFETFLTNENATMQYQLNTKLRKKILYSLDDIDSPEWLVVPPHQSHLSQKQTFQRHCRSFTRLAPGGNALILMHAPPVTNGGDITKPEFRKIVQTHDSGQEFHVEEEGTMILEGKMHLITYRTRRDAGVFDVRAKQPNADHVREGIYLCSVERHSMDKLNLLSYVSIGRHQTVAKLLPQKPKVELATCATSNFNVAKPVIVWPEKSVGCIRCRSYGYPKPKVEMRRKKSENSQVTEPVTGKKVKVSVFTNVAEAGIVESIYMFSGVDQRMAGYYVCSAGNSHGEVTHDFQIKVRPIRY